MRIIVINFAVGLVSSFTSKNPYFRSVEELQNREAQIENTTKLHLASGAIETIYTPDLGFNRGYRLSEWHVQLGQLIKTGDVICSLETDEIVFEFESTGHHVYYERALRKILLNSDHFLYSISFYSGTSFGGPYFARPTSLCKTTPL